MTVEKIDRGLQTLAGFQAIFKGLFGGGKAKKSFEIYDSADRKGVYALQKLRQDQHEDSKYAVYAFGTAGALAPELTQLLTDRVAAIDLGTIRYECVIYSRLEPWRGNPDSLADEETTVVDTAAEYEGVFVFPVADQVDCTYVIYAHKGGVDYIYPITEQQAQLISK